MPKRYKGTKLKQHSARNLVDS